MSSPEPVQSAAGQVTRAGVIGLGMIGSGIAVSLARSGVTPVVYDVRPKAVDALSRAPPLPPALPSSPGTAMSC